ncbi:MAG: hypothetical protein B7X04_02565 [Parcubacteria group bacterium 21-54-25]|nr:MAG: hypothetical protein B7X04_02565 [Parcubacteria group bacterium 21-54-25]HQU07762.1 DUF1059 domain-containing protein [Candidatus Paceibacterota bacterium]
MKQLTCHDIGVDCDMKFVGESEEDVMRQAEEHAAHEHNLPVIPPNIEKKCRAAITDISTNSSHGTDTVTSPAA